MSQPTINAVTSHPRTSVSLLLLQADGLVVAAAGAALLIVTFPALTAIGRWVMFAQAGAVALFAAAEALALRAPE